MNSIPKLFLNSGKTFVVILFVFLLFVPARAIDARNQQDPYDPSVDARAEIAKALAKAQQTNKHILLVFGANWCPWCRALHHLFETNKMVNDYLSENYEVVMVDVGRRDKNLDLDSLYSNPIKLGLLAIVVLNEQGKVIRLQETGSLETKNSQEKGHDPQRVMTFLKKWKHPVEGEK